MALVMPQLGFALLAVLGLQEFTDSIEKKIFEFKKFKKVLYVSGGLILLSFLIFLMSDFKGTGDSRMKEQYLSNITQQVAQGKQPTPEMQQQATQIVNGWMSALHDDRKSIFQADLLRSILFVVLAAGLCWACKGRAKISGAASARQPRMCSDLRMSVSPELANDHAP